MSNKETGVEPFFEANFTQMLTQTMKPRRITLSFKARIQSIPFGAGDANYIELTVLPVLAHFSKLMEAYQADEEENEQY